METHLTFGKCASGLWESKLTHQQKIQINFGPSLQGYIAPLMFFKFHQSPFNIFPHQHITLIYMLDSLNFHSNRPPSDEAIHILTS